MSENLIEVNEIIDYKNEISIDFANFTEDINETLAKHDSSDSSHANIVNSILENIENNANAVTAQIQAKLDLKANLATTSGVNTGDETNTTIKSKLGIVSATNDGYVTSVQKASWDAASTGAGEVLISEIDTTPDYIGNKLSGSSGINVTKTNEGNNEGLAITTDSTVTQQGNTFNGASELVRLNESGQLPSLDGSLLINLIKQNGSVAFTAEQKGVAPISSDGLTTKAYVQNLISSINYSDLANSNLANINLATALTNLGFSGQSFAANGYYKMPNGLILQWGISPSLHYSIPLTITLPIAFPTTLLNANVQATSYYAPSPECNNAIYPISKTQIVIECGGGNTQQYMWMAVGY